MVSVDLVEFEWLRLDWLWAEGRFDRDADVEGAEHSFGRPEAVDGKMNAGVAEDFVPGI